MVTYFDEQGVNEAYNRLKNATEGPNAIFLEILEEPTKSSKYEEMLPVMSAEKSKNIPIISQPFTGNNPFAAQTWPISYAPNPNSFNLSEEHSQPTFIKSDSTSFGMHSFPYPAYPPENPVIQPRPDPLKTFPFPPNPFPLYFFDFFTLVKVLQMI